MGVGLWGFRGWTEELRINGKSEDAKEEEKYSNGVKIHVSRLDRQRGR